MGQYLPHVRGVFKLIKTYKKDLETEVGTDREPEREIYPKVKKINSNSNGRNKSDV